MLTIKHGMAIIFLSTHKKNGSLSTHVFLVSVLGGTLNHVLLK